MGTWPLVRHVSYSFSPRCHSNAELYQARRSLLSSPTYKLTNTNEPRSPTAPHFNYIESKILHKQTTTQNGEHTHTRISTTSNKPKPYTIQHKLSVWCLRNGQVEGQLHGRTLATPGACRAEGQLIDAGNSDFSGEAVHVESVKSPSVRVSWAVHGGHLYRDGEIVNVYWAYWLV